ncbi:unnamed protein product [Rhizopus stolonifer]
MINSKEDIAKQDYNDEEWILSRESISEEVPVVRNDTIKFGENGDNERAFREAANGSSKRKVLTKIINDTVF